MISACQGDPEMSESRCGVIHWPTQREWISVRTTDNDNHGHDDEEVKSNG